jgi:hypothetical protein
MTIDWFSFVVGALVGVLFMWTAVIAATVWDATGSAREGGER